jgi:glucose/arabinose dehydrogenase
MKPLLAAAISLSFIATSFAADRVGPGVPTFWVRPGYKVTLAAENFGRDVRFVEVDDKGRLYVSQPSQQKIVQLTDKDGDGVFETKVDFVTDHDAVHGMQFVDGYLWFGMNGAVCKVKVNDDGTAGEVTTLVDGLPTGGGHWFRSICVVADGFFTSIGDSGNMTPEEYEGSDRQKIWKYSLDGKTRKVWSTGIRNTEKLRIRPGTDELWGCDHGSDNFGAPYGEKNAPDADPSLGKQAITDKMPPEEFNHYIEGGFYGHPFVVGDRVPRLEFKDRPDIAKLAAMTIPPAYKGGAHWANNGWTFVSKDYFPDAKGDAFIAYHGSWNAQKPVGYQIHRVFFDHETGQPYGGYAIVKLIADDATDGRQAFGRPCDVVEAPDGTLLFTDDKNRKVYRISKE